MRRIAQAKYGYFPASPDSIEGYLEFEDYPDIVLEIVSNSSVEKDNETLFDLYWRAGSPNTGSFMPGAIASYSTSSNMSPVVTQPRVSKAAGSSRASSANRFVSPDTATKWGIRIAACRSVERTTDRIVAIDHGSLYVSRAARIRFALFFSGRVSRIGSVVKTRRRPTAAA